MATSVPLRGSRLTSAVAQLGFVRQTTRMKHFTIILLLSLVVVLTGCHSPEVKFSDVRPAPTATVSSGSVTVHLGGDYLNSATYIHPKSRIDGQTVYIFGYRTLGEQSGKFVVRLPASVSWQSVTVIWIDPDGSHVTVPITK